MRCQTYSEFPPLDSTGGLTYATCSWKQSTRFYTLDQDRRRSETGQAERQFREEKHAPPVFPHGLHRNVHRRNVLGQQRLARIFGNERRGLRNQWRQSVRAGSLGEKGKDRRDAAERLRA